MGSYCLNLLNGIPVSPYKSGYDNELVLLAKYLEYIEKVPDVSEIISESLKKAFDEGSSVHTKLLNIPILK